MRRFLLSALLVSFVTVFTFAQNEPVTKANYELASRFSPNRLRNMVFSTSVDAHWLKNSNRFWYTYETSDGTNYYIVDPAKKSKSLMFDNVKMAADISRLTLDPFDAQNIPIKNLKFLDNEDKIQFEIKSKLVDEEEDDEENDMTEKKDKKKKKKGKPDMVHHLRR